METTINDNAKSEKRTREAGFIHIIIIAVIAIIGIIFIVSLFNSDGAANSIKPSDIIVEGVAADNKATITDSNYPLKYKIMNVSGRLITSAIVANGGAEQQAIQGVGTGNDINYSVTSLTGLRFGDNTIKVLVNETTSSGKKLLGTKDFTVVLNSSVPPVISVQNAQQSGDTLLANAGRDAKYTINVDTRTDANSTSGATSVTINGTAATYGAVAGSFTYDTPLKDGDNSYVIVAKNALGETSKTLIVRKPSQAELAQQGAVANAILDAEATCQEYAQVKFGVKDININKDQSSIERQNADGTILIKVNIADSQGVLRPEKPLGTMECTTSSDSLKVLKFLVY